MNVRAAEKGDRQSIIGVIEECDNLSREEKDCALELFDIYLNSAGQEDYFFLAAVTDKGGVEGYLCHGPASLASKVEDIYWVLVRPGARGKGVGACLMREAERLFKGSGVRMMVAETSGLSSYEDARKFYLKNGFEESARLKDFFKPGDDKVFYVKKL